MDISETGSQIAEKLLVLLDDRQRQELEEVIMSRIKQKLRVEPDIPDYISSVRGVGYKFNK